MGDPRTEAKASGSDLSYRGYRISFDPPPIPYRGCDWHFVHQDYDEGDRRFGHCASEAECRAEIDEIEDDR